MYGDFVSLAFSPFASTGGTPQAITTTADSSSIVDITGAGVGNAPSMIGYQGGLTALGADFGVGGGPALPYVGVFITSVTTASGTLTISLKAAPDSGTYTEGTYTTLYTSAALTGTTQLAAGNVLYFPVPPILVTMGEALPRFYKLSYAVGSSISLSVSAAIIPDMPSLKLGGKYGNNFVAL
jgi:hypothetical protein